MLKKLYTNSPLLSKKLLKDVVEDAVRKEISYLTALRVDKDVANAQHAAPTLEQRRDHYWLVAVCDRVAV